MLNRLTLLEVRWQRKIFELFLGCVRYCRQFPDKVDLLGDASDDELDKDASDDGEWHPAMRNARGQQGFKVPGKLDEDDDMDDEDYSAYVNRPKIKSREPKPPLSRAERKAAES